MDNDKEKFWDNLTKEYLTVDQKLDIIREHNSRISDEKWEKSMEALREWMERKKDE